jgi:large subunit ribosomal protein L21
MYTILETGGKQYRVGVGDTIDVELLGTPKGATVSFDRVLMFVGDDQQTLVGRPTLSQVKVTGEVLSDDDEDPVKGPKVTVFKFKRRKNMRRKTGHRQQYTRVKISGITVA